MISLAFLFLARTISEAQVEPRQVILAPNNQIVMAGFSGDVYNLSISSGRAKRLASASKRSAGYIAATSKELISVKFSSVEAFNGKKWRTLPVLPDGGSLIDEISEDGRWISSTAESTIGVWGRNGDKYLRLGENRYFVSLHTLPSDGSGIAISRGLEDSSEFSVASLKIGETIKYRRLPVQKIFEGSMPKLTLCSDGYIGVLTHRSPTELRINLINLAKNRSSDTYYPVDHNIKCFKSIRTEHGSIIALVGPDGAEFVSQVAGKLTRLYRIPWNNTPPLYSIAGCWLSKSKFLVVTGSGIRVIEPAKQRAEPWRPLIMDQE